METLLIILSAVCFAGALAYSLWQLFAKGRLIHEWPNFWAMLAGFTLISVALYQRGRLEGSCPLNSLYDVLLFQSWSLVLIFLLVGTTYRLSLMGAFTAPLALAILVAALVLPIPRDLVPREILNPWIETHAALSMIAYGAFGLACISGTMYLVQERQLKSHRFSQLLFQLPPIHALALSTTRLLLLGFLLLTVAFAAGFVSGLPVNGVKFAGSAMIWLVYGLILLTNRFWPWPSRRVALATIATFIAVLVTLPAIQYLSGVR
ncbi:MAG: c-type cytochrome biogenesis protein CcsB [Terrimicrobiaceae bacterium]